MIRAQPPDRERDTLETAFRATDDRKLRDRRPIVPVAARGRRPADIAADPGISTRTVPRWLNAYLDRGRDGLRPRKATGAAPKVPAALADEIEGWVIGGPAACGLDRANWTYAERAGHLYQTRGITAGRSAVPRSGQRLGVRVYRPTYRFPRADPADPATARAASADLTRGRRRATSSC
jgi:transposase